MPESNKIYDKEMITQLRDVEKSIVESSLTDDVSKQMAKEAEESSVQFLEGYVKGEIKLTDDAYDIMVNYLDYLSRSTSPEIKKNINNARNIYMSERYVRQKQKHQQDVIQSMGELDMESLKKGSFSILDNKKKREGLTSAQLLEMERIMHEDKRNNWSKRQNQLEDFAKKRIDDVLSGKKEKDENFEQLVQFFGSRQQKNSVRRQQETIEPEIIIPVQPKDTAPIIIGSEETIEEKSQPQKKSFREINKEKHQRKPKAAKEAEYPTSEQFAVLGNKDKAKRLSATELLELSDKLQEVKKAPKKHQFRTDKIENSLRSYTQNLIVKIRKGEVVATDEAAQLALRYAPQQLEAVRKQQAEQEDSRVVILSPLDNKNNNTKKKTSKDVIKKEPWYKKAWNVVKKPLVAVVTVGVLAVSSFAIKGALGGENKTSNNDAKKPLTEQNIKTNTENKTSQDNKNISSYDVQQELQKAKQQVQKTSQSTQASVNSAELSKDDEKYAVRSASFLKTMTNYNKTVKKDPALAEQNLQEAETRLNNFANSVKDKLPEGVSVERVKYLASFYSLFPNSEFGKKMTKMFNGEEVSVSKEEIAEVSENHGKFGTKYVNSLNVSKTSANQSR